MTNTFSEHFGRAENALDNYGHTLDDNFAKVMKASDKLEAVINNAIAKLRADAIERVRRQAAMRAKNNGADAATIATASDAAEAFLCEGLSHEEAITRAAGARRRVVA